jgi:hypothetical protein
MAAVVFVFPSFGAVVGGPVEMNGDAKAVTRPQPGVAVETQSGDDEAA